jgi:hypothetical protein
MPTPTRQAKFGLSSLLTFRAFIFLRAAETILATSVLLAFAGSLSI